METTLRPDTGDWLKAWNGEFPFLREMREKFTRQGALTRGQWLAVERCRIRDERVVAAPVASPTRVVAELPVGRHGVLVGDRTLFFRVRQPKEGRYVGWQFLEEQLGDNHRSAGFRRPNGEFVVRLPEAIEVIEQILEAPMVTLARYGRHIGSCGVCGRALTDEESRTLGIGPVCFARLRAGYGEAA